MVGFPPEKDKVDKGMQSNEEMAKAFFANQVKTSVRDVRNAFFQVMDSLKVDDLDNVEQLKTLLKDDDLGSKFSIFPENKSKLLRKIILDSTNGLERNLLEYIDNFDVDFRPDIQLQGLFRK